MNKRAANFIQTYITAVFTACVMLATTSVFASGNSSPGHQQKTPTPVIETCFSPAERCDQKLISYLATARTKLDIAIYSLTHSGISQAILDAHDRGVAIRIVADRLESQAKASLIENLKQNGIPVRIANVSGIMHNKFAIVDSKKLETGSYNYTNNATKNNAENQLYINNAAIAARYSSDFDRLWTNASGED